MRAILMTLAGTACAPEEQEAGDPPIDDGGTVEDPGDPPPEACSGPAALHFFGETSSQVLTPGVELTLEQGGQGGFHLRLGLAVESPLGDVAWIIQSVDPETGEVVMAANGGAITYTALVAWNAETCTGYLPDNFVKVGDELPLAEVCELEGRTVRAEAYVAPGLPGAQLPDEPQATLEILVHSGC